MLTVNRRVALLTLLFIQVFSSALGQSRDSASALRVVVTFSVLADMTRNIGGPQITITTLVGPNSDAHVYEPTPDDARALAQANLVIANGLGFERWLQRLIGASNYRGPVALATDKVTPRPLPGTTELDPHAWQSPNNGRHYATNIANALAKADVDHAALYQQRAAAYIASLAQLETDIRLRLDGIPKNSRRILTSHDAFGYLGAAYDLNFIAVQRWNTDIEPTTSDIVQLVRQIREQRVQAVFVENITDPRLVAAVASETGTRIGGTLYSDALSDEKGPASTYLAMIRYNIEAITQALATKR